MDPKIVAICVFAVFMLDYLRRYRSDSRIKRTQDASTTPRGELTKPLQLMLVSISLTMVFLLIRLVLPSHAEEFY